MSSMSTGPMPVGLLNGHQLQQQPWLAPQQLELQKQLLLRQQDLQRQQLEVHQQLQLHQFHWMQQLHLVQAELQGASYHGGEECKKPRNPTNPALRNAKGEVIDPCSWKDKPTTVMVRRIPRHYTQRQLLEMVEFLGFGGLFDFLYLPWDIKYNRNSGGFGFLNFREPEYALMFRDSCTRHEVEGKTLEVHPAQLQGFEANYQHFANSKIGQHAAHRPIFLQASTPDW